MARLAGVDLPREKRMVIALTYIYGVGPTRAKETLSSLEGDAQVADEELAAAQAAVVDAEGDLADAQAAAETARTRLADHQATLSDARADEAHPAFTNLFVRAEWQASQQALVFARQPRLPTEHGLQVAHFLADTDPQTPEVRLQTDRQRWLGRNRAVGDPLAEFDAAPVGTGDERVRLDTGLDPVCAMAVRLRLAPHSVSQLTFATAASDNGGTLHAVIDKYRQPSHVKRASLMSATLTGIRLRALRISPEHFAAVQLLSTALLFSLTRPPTRVAALEDLGLCDRRLLWRFGLSGERPLVLVQVGVVQDLGLLRSLAQALRLWSWGEVACDLVWSMRSRRPTRCRCSARSTCCATAMPPTAPPSAAWRVPRPRRCTP